MLKASRHCERVATLVCGNSLQVWEREHLPKLESIRNLTSISIDQKFISKLVSRLERNIRWSVTRTEGSLYLAVADEMLETNLHLKV
jgi:uncharacterized protein YaeQ